MTTPLGVGLAVQDRLAYRGGASAAVWGEQAVRTAPPLRDVLDLKGNKITDLSPLAAMNELETGRPPLTESELENLAALEEQDNPYRLADHDDLDTIDEWRYGRMPLQRDLVQHRFLRERLDKQARRRHRTHRVRT